MQVFIIYGTHEDGAFANRVASDLERLGVETCALREAGKCEIIPLQVGPSAHQSVLEEV